MSEFGTAAWDTGPNAPVIFFSFRIMVACGLYFIALFALTFYLSARHRLDRYRLFLHAAFWSLPLPWIIDGVLPTFLPASPLHPAKFSAA